MKKANKLFNSRDFGIRKTFIIPLSDELYSKYILELEQHQKREEERRNEVLSLFIERAHCNEEIASVYLSHSHFHLERALDRYRLEHTTTTEPLNIRQPTKYAAIAGFGTDHRKVPSPPTPPILTSPPSAT